MSAAQRIEIKKRGPPIRGLGTAVALSCLRPQGKVYRAIVGRQYKKAELLKRAQFPEA